MLKRQKKPLKSHYPPYKRNQIRWALQCYRWKIGLPWEHYAYVIASELGLEEEGQGLNKRDPYSWIIEGKNPNPEKLSLYEKFIDKVAPEYAKAYTEDGFLESLSGLFSRFVAPGLGDPEESDGVLEKAEKLERFVYLDSVYKIPIDRLLPPHYWFFVVRRIAQSPSLKIFFFGIENDRVRNERIRLRKEKVPLDVDLFLAERRKSDTKDGRSKEEIEFQHVIDLVFDDDTPVTELQTGFVVPDSRDNRYVGIAKRADGNSVCVQFALCSKKEREIESPTQPTVYYDFKDVDFENLYIALSLMRDRIDQYELYYARTAHLRMRAAYQDSIQNLVSLMRSSTR